MSDIVTRDLIIASGSATTKEEAIREAGALLLKAEAVTPAYVEAMLERERSITTYMGSYLAIPHGFSDEANPTATLYLYRGNGLASFIGSRTRIGVGWSQ